MNESEEKAFDCGNRLAWVYILRECLRQLGYQDTETWRVAWIAEREAAIAQLRALCAKFGDNEWYDNLHLADIIEKHLANYFE